MLSFIISSISKWNRLSLKFYMKLSISYGNSVVLIYTKEFSFNVCSYFSSLIGEASSINGYISYWLVLFSVSIFLLVVVVVGIFFSDFFLYEFSCLLYFYWL